MLKEMQEKKEKNGYFLHEKKEYILIQKIVKISKNKETYNASFAISPEDLPDKEGDMPLYLAYWKEGEQCDNKKIKHCQAQVLGCPYYIAECGDYMGGGTMFFNPRCNLN